MEKGCIGYEWVNYKLKKIIKIHKNSYEKQLCEHTNKNLTQFIIVHDNANKHGRFLKIDKVKLSDMLEIAGVLLTSKALCH